MDPVSLGAATALSIGASLFSSSKQKKAERAAEAQANALATEQRNLADARETAATTNNINSINSQRLSDLTNINFASQIGVSNAQASTAGSGISGQSINDLTTQVIIDSARDVANVNREANSLISDNNTQLANAQANRSIEAKYKVQPNKISSTNNAINAGLNTLAGGVMNLKF